MSFRLLQISDLHFGTEVEQVLTSLRQSIQDLKPSLVVVTGDITQRATQVQFQKAKSFLDSLSQFPILCCPGNHDIPLFNVFSRFLKPYQNYRKILKTQTEGFFSHPEVEVLVLNSTSRFRHIDGALESRYLKDQLKSFTNQPTWKVVALHHPLDCKQKIDEKNILLNSNEVMEEFAASGVHLVISGHIHDPFFTTSAYRYPSLRKRIHLSVCGTSASHRIRRNAPQSFMVYDFPKLSQNTDVLNQRFDYNTSTGSFAVVNSSII